MVDADLSGIIGSRYGSTVTVVGLRSVRGGDINRCALITLSTGGRLFLKENPDAPPGMFAAEAAGLEALRSAEACRVPDTIAVGSAATRDGAVDSSYLLLEYIEQGGETPQFWERFGTELAQLHRWRSPDFIHFGFPEDNFIGLTPQPNGSSEQWIPFFRDERLGYQVQLAESRGLLSGEMHNALGRVMDRLDSLLIEPETPSLLHGDLWSGNFLAAVSGEPVLIDPAVSCGHREADLAMTQLFGGFDPRFYEAYAEALPLEPGYAERKPIYNLYHLLNHLNLFGRTYEESIRQVLRKYG